MNFALAIGGRASRSDYWCWTLFVVLVSLVGNSVDAQFGAKNVGLILDLLLFLPNFAMGSRRLRDIDRTFWWSLLVFTIISVLGLLYGASVAVPERHDPARHGVHLRRDETPRILLRLPTEPATLIGIVTALLKLVVFGPAYFVFPTTSAFACAIVFDHSRRAKGAELFKSIG